MTLPEPRSVTGCATCTTARCCLAFDPELTVHDVARLLALGLDVEDFVALRPTRRDQAGEDALLDEEERSFELRLKQTGDRKRPEDGPTDAAEDPRRCGFLVTLGRGVSRCGVYEARPMVCRLFPSARTALGVFVATPEAICPPGAFAQERADLATLGLLYAIADDERAVHRAFVRRWNTRAAETRRISGVLGVLGEEARQVARTGLAGPAGAVSRE